MEKKLFLICAAIGLTLAGTGAQAQEAHPEHQTFFPSASCGGPQKTHDAAGPWLVYVEALEGSLEFSRAGTQVSLDCAEGGCFASLIFGIHVPLWLEVADLMIGLPEEPRLVGIEAGILNRQSGLFDPIEFDASRLIEGGLLAVGLPVGDPTYLFCQMVVIQVDLETAPGCTNINVCIKDLIALPTVTLGPM